MKQVTVSWNLTGYIYYKKKFVLLNSFLSSFSKNSNAKTTTSCFPSLRQGFLSNIKMENSQSSCDTANLSLIIKNEKFGSEITYLNTTF